LWNFKFATRRAALQRLLAPVVGCWWLCHLAMGDRWFGGLGVWGSGGYGGSCLHHRELILVPLAFWPLNRCQVFLSVAPFINLFLPARNVIFILFIFASFNWQRTAAFYKYIFWPQHFRGFFSRAPNSSRFGNYVWKFL